MQYHEDHWNTIMYKHMFPKFDGNGCSSVRPEFKYFAIIEGDSQRKREIGRNNSKDKK